MWRLVLIPSVIPALATLALAETYVVNPQGTGDFPTIQAAISAAMDGDVIELTDGVFTGQGNRDIGYWGKAITIRSQNGNPSYCIIDCEGTETDPHRGFYFQLGEGPGSILEGVTIRRGHVGDESGAGIYCYESAPTIRDCILWGHSARCGGAIDCIRASPAITECQFLLNEAQYGGAIIYCWESSPSLSDCVFRDNTAYDGGAIYT